MKRTPTKLLEHIEPVTIFKYLVVEIAENGRHERLMTE